MNSSNDSGVKANASLAYPARLPAAGPQRSSQLRPIGPPGGLEGLRKPSTLMPGNSSGTGSAQEAGELADEATGHVELRHSKRAGLHGVKRTKASLGWLARDPSEWVGRKILNRKTGKIYVVRDVYTNGRVELEKSWMTYSFYVWTVRADFEPYS